MYEPCLVYRCKYVTNITHQIGTYICICEDSELGGRELGGNTVLQMFPITKSRNMLGIRMMLEDRKRIGLGDFCNF